MAPRTDFDDTEGRRAARLSKTGAQTDACSRWPRSMDGSSRTGAARIGGVTLQIVRAWVMKFNAAFRDGLIDRKALG
ncbi:hypothetical protein [Sphingomonas solaris]|uniref:Uncharacterized protein n=1 Tax=Alterirhizorhabdus solaris TaxID=2529389 RepID=A0A558QWW9_9SPHN|nr:hypothetical protein FOY91_16310 [Sphingomonas solaris]